MATSLDGARSVLRAPLRPRMIWLMAPLALAGAVAGLSWWFTEPLEERGQHADHQFSSRTDVSVPEPAATPSKQLAAWPTARLDGPAAKQLLLDSLLSASRELEQVRCYTATFHKQERIAGRLGPEQTLEMKVRQRPFAIYFKFLLPNPGKEVVYAEGHHENKVIAHTGGVAGWLVPRLAVPPDHPLALAENRHAVTEAGLANLTTKLIGFRRMDLTDPEAVTILDRTTNSSGHTYLRSIHTHPHRRPERPFARVEVLYDCDSRIPLEIKNFDWPEPEHHGELLLAEHYAYEKLNFDADLTSVDFDPANPAYAFHRY